MNSAIPIIHIKEATIIDFEYYEKHQHHKNKHLIVSARWKGTIQIGDDQFKLTVWNSKYYNKGYADIFLTELPIGSKFSCNVFLNLYTKVTQCNTPNPITAKDISFTYRKDLKIIF